MSPSVGPSGPNEPTWLDRSRQAVYEALWHNAMRIDQLFGSSADEAEYRKASGSLSPAVLWDEYRGSQTPIRFSVDLPLPRLDERFHAFVGRVDPNEYVTESEEPSGAFRRQYGPATQDQTLFGLTFHEPPRQGGYFDSGAGIRLNLPLDPFLKGSYVYVRGTSEHGLVSLRETAFWEHVEGFGLTTRANIEQIFEMRWLARLTASVTFSQKSEGLSYWSTVNLTRGFPSRRAIVLELEIDGQTDAPVPLHDYGAKFAYRQSVLRKWLIMEMRTSLSWPKDLVQQERRPTVGVGVGFEVLFGTEEFRARPVTF